MEGEQRPFGGRDDPLYEQAVMIVRGHRKPSLAMLQRHLRIGFNRASYMLEAMVGTVIDSWGPGGKLLPAKEIPNEKGNMMLNPEQKARLLAMMEQGKGAEALDECAALCEDALAAKLLERGGYGTLQLNPPGSLPRMRFVDPADVQPVAMAKIGGVLVSRDQVSEA